MLDLREELRGIIEALDRAGISYALAGGLAVSLYAVPRATEDIDLAIAVRDRDAALRAVAPLGYRWSGRPIPVARGRLSIQRVIKIEGTDLVPLDFLMAVDPEIAEWLADRVAMEWNERRVYVVSRRSLRALKRLRGSPQDLADLHALGPEDP